MEEPLFYAGQKVVYHGNQNHEQGNKGSVNPLINDKSYYVSNPDMARDQGKVYISLAGIGEKKGFKQTSFTPADWDNEVDEQIRESLNEHLKINN